MPCQFKELISKIFGNSQIYLWQLNDIVPRQTARHLATRVGEHFRSVGKLKSHFENCNVDPVPTKEMVKILGKAKGDKLLTLEALYISELGPKLNTKDEFKSRELKLKF